MRVLVIDDESSVRRALLRAFQIKGHVVEASADAIEGETIWKSFEPDVVVLDILMPQVTGPQLLEKLSNYLKKTPTKVILISAYSGNYDMKVLKLKGANLFIEKPFSDIFTVVSQAEGLFK